MITGSPVLLDSGDVARAVRASCAIPGLVQPVELDGMLLVDGGLLEDIPCPDMICGQTTDYMVVNVTDQTPGRDLLESICKWLPKVLPGSPRVLHRCAEIARKYRASHHAGQGTGRSQKELS